MSKASGNRARRRRSIMFSDASALPVKETEKKHLLEASGAGIEKGAGFIPEPAPSMVLRVALERFAWVALANPGSAANPAQARRCLNRVALLP